jgi:hypothetical protein
MPYSVWISGFHRGEAVCWSFLGYDTVRFGRYGISLVPAGNKTMIPWLFSPQPDYYTNHAILIVAWDLNAVSN